MYGEKLTMEEQYNKSVDKEGNYVKGKREVSFPTYAEITKRSKDFKEQEMKKIFKRMAVKSEEYALSEIGMDDLVSINWSPGDPFSMKDIAVNLRSMYQVKTHCSICGCEPSPGNEIEMHHIKHVRKGNV